MGPNILPLRLREELSVTCRGRTGTELRLCIESLTSSMESVVVNTSHSVQRESLLTQFGLGRMKTKA